MSVQSTEQDAHSNFRFVVFEVMKGDLPLRDVERIVKKEYMRFIRSQSASDAEAAKKLGLAPPNYHRLCKQLGIK